MLDGVPFWAIGHARGRRPLYNTRRNKNEDDRHLHWQERQTVALRDVCVLLVVWSRVTSQSLGLPRPCRAVGLQPIGGAWTGPNGVLSQDQKRVLVPGKSG